MNLNLLRKIDKYVLVTPTFILGLRKKGKIKTPKKILLIKLWAMGDAILTLSLIKALKVSFPQSQIDVLVHKNIKKVYENNTDITNLLEFGVSFKALKYLSQFKKYDLCLDLEPYLNVSALASWYSAKDSIGFSHGSRARVYTITTDLRKDQHMVQNYLDLIRKLNIRYDTLKLEKIEVDPTTKEKVNAILKSYNLEEKDFLVGICPGVGESVKTRMWPLEKMAQLADRLIETKKAKIILIDGPDNTELAQKMVSLTKYPIVNLVGKTSFKESAYLIEKCKLFISNDTGPMHLAAAQGTKTIGLFGPNTPIRWTPYGKKNKAIYKNPSCSPCIINEKGIMPECKYKGTALEQHCMKNISVEEVIKEVK